jgi:hypothetical protein
MERPPWNPEIPRWLLAQPEQSYRSQAMTNGPAVRSTQSSAAPTTPTPEILFRDQPSFATPFPIRAPSGSRAPAKNHSTLRVPVVVSISLAAAISRLPPYAQGPVESDTVGKPPPRRVVVVEPPVCLPLQVPTCTRCRPRIAAQWIAASPVDMQRSRRKFATAISL